MTPMSPIPVCLVGRWAPGDDREGPLYQWDPTPISHIARGLGNTIEGFQSGHSGPSPDKLDFLAKASCSSFRARVVTWPLAAPGF